MKIILILIILFFVASVLAVDNSTNVSYEDDENSGPEINNSNETDGAEDSGGGGGGSGGGASREINESLNQFIINNLTNQTGDADLNLTEESSISGGVSFSGGSSSGGGSSGGSGWGSGGGGSSSTAKNTQIDNSAITSVGDTTPEENNEGTNLADENQTPQESPSLWQRILNLFRDGEPTGASITGAVIGEDGQLGSRNMEIVIISLVIIAGIAGVLIWHKKRKAK